MIGGIYVGQDYLAGLPPFGNVDYGVVASTTRITSVDVAAYIDNLTVRGITSPSIPEIRSLVDAAVVPGVTFLSLVEFDAGVVTGVTSITTGEVYTAGGTLPPYVTDIAITSPTVITLTYNKHLTTNSPDAFQFVVSASGGPCTVTSASASGFAVTLNLSRALSKLEIINVSYTPA